MLLILAPTLLSAQSFTSKNAVQGNKWFKGFVQFAKEVFVKDTIHIDKGVVYADGTVGTTGFTSGDTIQLQTLVVTRDSLYIGTDGYVHYVKDGYNVRLAVKDSISTDSQLLTDLLAYWTLDESSGNALDASGNNYSGTPAGGVTHGATGKIGNAYDFEFDDLGYLNFGNTLGSLFETQDLSVSFWINVESQSGNHGIIGTWNGENAWWIYTASGTITAALNWGGSNYLTTSNSAISTGAWHHIVFTVDRDGYTKLYIDGAVQNSSIDISAGAGSNLHTTNQFDIGTWGDQYTGTCFDGIIDEVGIWTRVLSATDVSTLNNSGNGKTYPF